MSFEHSSLPISTGSDVVNTEKTPFGIPAFSAKSQRAKADNGVSSGALATKQQPAASAGPSFLVIIALGKFQGVIAATTPTGCFNTIILLSSWCPGIVSP